MGTVVAIAVPAAFVAGVVFHAVVVSQAAKIKQDLDAAETRIRADISALLKKGGTDVAGVASKL
ncbi:MAG TPA: hypothetical protein VE866_15270 [Candidatus Binatia bacterium]|jgi:hypothetical protein|nr:hypothetical protein [Candidatus Binatia bacterium]